MKSQGVSALFAPTCRLIVPDANTDIPLNFVVVAISLIAVAPYIGVVQMGLLILSFYFRLLSLRKPLLSQPHQNPYQ